MKNKGNGVETLRLLSETLDEGRAKTNHLSLPRVRKEEKWREWSAEGVSGKIENPAHFLLCSVPVMAIFADHLLVPSIIWSSHCSIASIWVSGSMEKVVLKTTRNTNEGRNAIGTCLPQPTDTCFIVFDSKRGSFFRKLTLHWRFEWFLEDQNASQLVVRTVF